MTTTKFNINLTQTGYYGNKYFIRCTDTGTVQPAFSRYGDTLLIIPSYDTDNVINITTGKSYTYGGEQGTRINDINEFPLTKTELENLTSMVATGRI
jgi:hypothetical protein